MTDPVLAEIRRLAPPGAAELALPAIRLAYTDDGPRPGATRVGGLPDWPAERPWPRWRGTCMDFLAQVDLAGLPAIEGLPTQGWLYFFYSAYGETWGLDPNEEGSAAVIHHVGNRSDLTSNYRPPDFDLDATFEPFMVRPSKIWTMPSSVSDLGAPFQGYAAVETYLIEHYDTDRGATWLLGHAAQFQSRDPAALAEIHGPPGDAPYRLLLQLSPPDHWGFAGVLYFYWRGSPDAIWVLRED
jgi:hypothetical protein